MFISSAIVDIVYLSPVNQLLLEMSGATTVGYLQHSIYGITEKYKEKSGINGK
jgi:hypothetical protein